MSTDEEDAEEDVPRPVGQPFWMTVMGADPGPTRIPLNAAPGPIRPAQHGGSAMDYADLFFPHQFLQRLVDETKLAV